LGSACTIGAHRQVGGIINISQLAAVVYQEALRAGELILELGNYVDT